jgi:hypothetical protein
MNRAFGSMSRAGWMIALLFSGSAMAQAGADALAACGRLIDHGLRQVEERFGSSTYLDTLYHDYCNISSSNSSSDKNAAFGFAIEGVPFNFSAGSKSNSEKRSEFCGTYKTTTFQAAQSYSMTSKFYTKALESWDKCLALAATRVVIDTNIAANRKSMNTLVVWNGSGTPNIKFLGVDTAGPIACSRNGTPIGNNEDVLITTEAMHINCARQSVGSNYGGVPAQLFEEARVVFKTTSAFLPIEFDAMVDEPARAQLQSLQSQITQLDERMRVSQARFGKMKMTTTCLARHAPSCGGHGAGVEALPCPDGFRDSGLRESNWWSGGSCGQGSTCKVCVKFDE